MNAMKRTLYGALCGAGLLLGTPTLSHATDKDSHARTARAHELEDKHDDALEAQLRSDLANDTRLKAYDVKVGVDDGVVTLKGDVPSQADKQHAEDVAQRLGFKRVKNDLDVDRDVKPLSEKARLDRQADLTRDRAADQAANLKRDADRKADDVKDEAERKADALEDRADHAADHAKNDAHRAKVRTRNEVREHTR